MPNTYWGTVLFYYVSTFSRQQVTSLTQLVSSPAIVILARTGIATNRRFPYENATDHLPRYKQIFVTQMIARR